MIRPHEMSDAELAADYRRMQEELYAQGKVADCDHELCHSSLYDSPCLRHEVAYRLRILTRRGA